MSEKLNSAIAVIGIDIGKNSFHVVGHDARGAINAAAKVVAWPSGSAARQYTPDRHGSLRRRSSPEPKTRIAFVVSSCRFDLNP